MTTRLKGFIVALELDIRDDDAESIMEAIRHLRYVLDVQPVTANSEDWINRTRVRRELQAKILDALEEKDA